MAEKPVNSSRYGGNSAVAEAELPGVDPLNDEASFSSTPTLNSNPQNPDRLGYNEVLEDLGIDPFDPLNGTAFTQKLRGGDLGIVNTLTEQERAWREKAVEQLMSFAYQAPSSTREEDQTIAGVRVPGVALAETACAKAARNIAQPIVEETVARANLQMPRSFS